MMKFLVQGYGWPPIERRYDAAVRSIVFKTIESERIWLPKKKRLLLLLLLREYQLKMEEMKMFLLLKQPRERRFWVREIYKDRKEKKRVTSIAW